MIIVYTKENCNMCKILKTKLEQNHIPYQECFDYTKLQEHGIDMLPIVETEGETFWNLALALDEIKLKGSEAFGD